VMVLYGKKGIGKSTAFRILAGDDYFSDSPIQIGSNKAFEQLRMVWIYEVAELDSIRRRDASSVKAFFSAQEDTYVRPYGRVAVRMKRHTVFCGTTNDKFFLTEATNRRFWPVESSGTINDKWLIKNREQLWAEAVALYNRGTLWYLDGVQAQDLDLVSAEHQQADPWEDLIEDWAKVSFSPKTSTEILKDAIKMEPDRMTRFHEIRIQEILQAMGWTCKRTSRNGKFGRFWARPGSVTSLETERETL